MYERRLEQRKCKRQLEVAEMKLLYCIGGLTRDKESNEKIKGSVLKVCLMSKKT